MFNGINAGCKAGRVPERPGKCGVLTHCQGLSTDLTVAGAGVTDPVAISGKSGALATASRGRLRACCSHPPSFRLPAPSVLPLAEAARDPARG